MGPVNSRVPYQVGHASETKKAHLVSRWAGLRFLGAWLAYRINVGLPGPYRATEVRDSADGTTSEFRGCVREIRGGFAQVIEETIGPFGRPIGSGPSRGRSCHSCGHSIPSAGSCRAAHTASASRCRGSASS